LLGPAHGRRPGPPRAPLAARGADQPRGRHPGPARAGRLEDARGPSAGDGGRPRARPRAGGRVPGGPGAAAPPVRESVRGGPPDLFRPAGGRAGAMSPPETLGFLVEAVRHNIRGEHISVDTIPLVGEQTLAEAVRAVARLPRARVLVLAGALMGGDIEKAVREIRARGVLVISLNMAGSVPEAADLVV